MIPAPSCLFKPRRDGIVNRHSGDRRHLPRRARQVVRGDGSVRGRLARGCRGARRRRGSNGSGKTTLLKILAGLLRRDHGPRPARAGRDGLSGQARRLAVGWAGPDLALYGELTGEENLRFFRRAAGRDAEDADIRRRLSETGLSTAAAAAPRRGLLDGDAPAPAPGVRAALRSAAARSSTSRSRGSTPRAVSSSTGSSPTRGAPGPSSWRPTTSGISSSPMDASSSRARGGPRERWNRRTRLGRLRERRDPGAADRGSPPLPFSSLPRRRSPSSRTRSGPSACARRTGLRSRPRSSGSSCSSPPRRAFPGPSSSEEETGTALALRKTLPGALVLAGKALFNFALFLAIAAVVDARLPRAARLEESRGPGRFRPSCCSAAGAWRSSRRFSRP